MTGRERDVQRTADPQRNCPECEGSGNVDGGICAVCRGAGLRQEALGCAPTEEWERLCGELRARESQMSGILCDLADVPSDPVEGLRVLAEYWRRQRPAESTPVIGECEACDDFHWCFPGGRRRESPQPDRDSAAAPSCACPKVERCVADKCGGCCYCGADWKTSGPTRPAEEDTTMRATGEKPDPVGRASGMAGARSDEDKGDPLSKRAPVAGLGREPKDADASATANSSTRNACKACGRST